MINQECIYHHCYIINIFFLLQFWHKYIKWSQQSPLCFLSELWSSFWIRSFKTLFFINIFYISYMIWENILNHSKSIFIVCRVKFFVCWATTLILLYYIYRELSYKLFNSRLNSFQYSSTPSFFYFGGIFCLIMASVDLL